MRRSASGLSAMVTLALAPHHLKRALRIAANSSLQLPSVLLREESLGYHDVEINIQADRRAQHQHHGARMMQSQVERPFIAAPQPPEAALESPAEPRGFARAFALEQQRAHHRSRRQRDHQRDQDRYR